MDDIKQVIADNIVFYRRENGMTQVELADKLNYSDKAVSKWERAESYPDIVTLIAMAKLFNVTLDELVADRKKIKKAKPIISLLSGGLVWLIATAAYVIMNMISTIPYSWLAFVYAIPVCAVVMLVLFVIWGKKLLVLIAETIIIWSVAACIFLTIYVVYPSLENSFFIFFLPIPLQILAVLWYELKVKGRRKFSLIRRRVKKDKDKDNDKNKNI